MLPGASSATRALVTDFAEWLRTNRDRFPVRVLASRKWGKDGREYRLTGVPALRIWVGTSSLEIAVMFRRECVDFLAHFDVYLARNRKGGWYCSQCRNGKRTTRKDRLSFLSWHSFEPLLDWCREHVRTDAVLVVQGKPPSSTAAYVVPRKKLPSLEARLSRPLFVEPLFRRPRVAGAI
jgi:hypothetical protein